ncbi:MAG: FliM/FliN family flagellar motor switch protein [Deltaproteobacteria bacterium]|nr:FliM/FliN family flagellar motor switch protein [Deltaproteobacteria bacterium]
MNSPRIKSFPFSKLPKINKDELDLCARSGHREWLQPISKVASILARRMGLGGASLEIVKVQTIRIEDLRKRFPGRWRFAVLTNPLGERMGFLALDPLLVSSLVALHKPEHSVARGWTQNRPGETGVIGLATTSALEELSSNSLAGGWSQWRYAGLAESAGEIGRVCFNQDVMVGTKIRIQIGWEEGFAIWLEPETSVNRRPSGSLGDPCEEPDWTAIADLKIHLVLQIGTSSLRYRELNGIQVGDIILMDQAEQRGKVNMKLGPITFRGTLEGPNITVENIHTEAGGEAMLSSEILSQGEGQCLSSTEVNSLPVELIVEAGRFEMTVSQVAGMKPGDVVTLSKAVLGPVDLRVGGQLVAKGELVEVEGKRGVRLCEVALVYGVDDEDLV